MLYLKYFIPLIFFNFKVNDTKKAENRTVWCMCHPNLDVWIKSCVINLRKKFKCDHDFFRFSRILYDYFMFFHVFKFHFKMTFLQKSCVMC